MIGRILLPFLIVVTLLSSCTPRVPRIPFDGTIASTSLTATIREKLTARDGELTSLRALADAEISDTGHGGSQGVAHLREAVVFVKPDKLRLEILPTQGAYALSLLVTNNGSLTYLEPPEKRAVRGSESERVIYSILKLAVGERELMSLLTGRIPPRYLSKEGGAALLVSRDSSSYLLSRGDGAEDFEIDSESLFLKRVTFRSRFNDSLVGEITYSSVGNSTPPLPREVSIESAGLKQRIHLTWSVIKPNVVVPDSLFEVGIPSDFRVYSR